MTTKRTLMTTACFASLCGALYGQTNEKTTLFQYFVTNDATSGNMSFKMEGIGKTVTGKPLSGTEERETVQVLSDGTRIDNRQTDKYFRDAQGRTRIERENGATAVISDPVTGSTTEMSITNKTSTTNKTARKMLMQMRTNGEAGGMPNTVMLDKLKAEMTARRATAVQEVTSDQKQDLGTQIVNGVSAQGTRSTITIPAGQIGNDREIKVVSERWFSSDLQMLIKSSNSDPRFGETTYQLTNVIQGAQDPSLFVIPPEFSTSGVR